jgi:hypothetical protein
MRVVSFYHKETGLLADSRILASDDATVVLNTPANHGVIEGHHDHLSTRVDVATGEILDYQPPSPSTDHEWNAESKRWQLSAAATDRAQRRTAAAARIAALEVSQHRLVREVLLGRVSGLAKLQLLDDEISSLRSQVGL